MPTPRTLERSRRRGNARFRQTAHGVKNGRKFYLRLSQIRVESAMSTLLFHELHEARDRVQLLKQRLQEARQRELPDYVPFLDEQTRILDETLKQADIPDCYKVAVVGRFKVGKSAFVNRLLGERLAGVNVGRETAAISVFRYDENARAEVELVSKKEWERLEKAHREDPKNCDVRRYDGFIHFSERQRSYGPSDIENLAQTWIQEGGKRHIIAAPDWGTREGKTRFRKDLLTFTSGQQPLHYLVDTVTIYAPIPLLNDHIQLIDTPGLDDTELFRVQLTEDLVRDVDAILFLTSSGAAFSQNDKEFIIRQLRQRQIKHLQIIVTRCDQTFEEAVGNVEEDGDLPTYNDFCSRQTIEVKARAQETLDELLRSNELTDDDRSYYLEQLDQFPVRAISTTYHDKGDAAKGGIEAVRDDIYRILSTSRRFADSKSFLCQQLDLVLKRVYGSYSERLGALEKRVDPATIDKEISAISQSVSSQIDAFQQSLQHGQGRLKRDQEAYIQRLPDHLRFVAAQTTGVLTDMRLDDLARGQRAIRCGRWGHLADLKARVADQVFPKVETLLNTLCGYLDTFIGEAKERMSVLQAAVKQIEEDHHLGSLEPLPLGTSLASQLDSLSKEFQSSVKGERDRIVRSLDDFVTQEVECLLEQAREKVSRLRGANTKTAISNELYCAYMEIRNLLVKAMRGHLEACVKEFSERVQRIAEFEVPALIRHASQDVIQQRLKAIASAKRVAKDGEREQVSAFLSEMVAILRNFAAEPMRPACKTPRNIPRISQQRATLQVEADSVLLEQHYEILEGATGYTYERIFRPYMDGATEITVEDPYIRSNHQVANFTRFCALTIRVGSVKSIELITGQRFGESTDDADSRLETLRRDLQSRNIALKWTRVDALHDREFRFNNGWTVKIGRGLDIYQKPENWVSVEAEDYSLRRCRQTKVDIFRGATVE